MDPHYSPWPDLCRDMLEYEIAERLDSEIDRHCLRAVCRSWRSLLPEPCRTPPLSLPFPMGPSPHLKPSRCGSFNLVHSTVYCLVRLKKSTETWKSAKCWLIRTKETEKPGKFRLKHPLCRSVNSEYLSRPLPTELNLLDYRVYEITKVYHLQFVGTLAPAPEYPELISLIPVHIAVCSVGPAFGVIAINTGGRLSIWRKGYDNWTCLGSRLYIDVVCHKGKFYAQSVSGSTFSIDLSLKIARVTPPERGLFHSRLLSYLGDLFLLVRNTDPAAYIPDSYLSTKFRVYKLNEHTQKWVRERSLKNMAMFVGDDCRFCVSTEECVGCKKNCIYYIQNYITTPVGAVESVLSRDTALFDLEDCSAKLLSRVWNYCGLFRPPISWFETWLNGLQGWW